MKDKYNEVKTDRGTALKKKLNYRFHNPNDEETTANYILDILIKSKQSKFEEIIRAVVENEEESKLAG